jgi:hypothetical protein
MNIGVICLANGPYSIFIDNLIDSCEEKLLPKHSKEYFIITDEEDNYTIRVNSNTIIKPRNGWPLDCLLRPQYSHELEDKIKHLDYIYFFNANIYIYSEINEEILPDESGLVGVEHPHYNHRQNISFTYDRNPNTQAYIPLGEGLIYYQACFWGGSTKNFLELSETITNWVNQDLENEVEPIWLDESYLNKYFLLNPPKTLSSIYAWPESFPIYENSSAVKIVQLEKNNYIQGNFKYKQ